MRREAAAYAGVELNRFGSAAWNFVSVFSLWEAAFCGSSGVIAEEWVLGGIPS